MWARAWPYRSHLTNSLAHKLGSPYLVATYHTPPPRVCKAAVGEVAGDPTGDGGASFDFSLGMFELLSVRLIK